jgi:SAM-dependent methyltransferase
VTADERWSFDKVPEIYDRARPGYPASLFDDLFAYARSPAAPRVVEIGPGTGQATKSLLERGARVTAVELGPNLAAFLRQKFAGSERLDVINAAFEDADLPSAFDIVFSATAFHWVDPAVRYAKAYALLRRDGVLAIVSTNQIASEVDRGFFDRTFPLYVKYQFAVPREKLPGEDVVPFEHGEMTRCGLFEDVTLLRYRWDQTYSTAQYADLVRSYGNTGTMEPSAREGLIADLSAVIDAEYGGSVTRPLVITLTMGRRRSL